jgi:hypothetical protein
VLVQCVLDVTYPFKGAILFSYLPSPLNSSLILAILSVSLPEGLFISSITSSVSISPFPV